MAIKEYKIRNITVRPCGIVVCLNHPQLGVMPDGLVVDDMAMEVKCPYNVRNEHIRAKTVPYLLELNGQLDLYRSYNYYMQVQCQMLVTERLI